GRAGHRHGQLPVPDRPAGRRRPLRAHLQLDPGACRMSIRRDERGQSVVMAVVFMAALLGMSAAVLDLGSWFRADRRVQATADAAALAGAQALPSDPASARAIALDYAQRNGDTISDADVTLSR